jgi:hypothetical protein
VRVCAELRMLPGNKPSWCYGGSNPIPYGISTKEVTIKIATDRALI